MQKIVIPFVQLESINPNVKGSNYSDQLTTYFKCICVCFSSLRKFNPNLSLQLTTNKLITEPFKETLKNLNVQVILKDYSFLPPEEMGPQFKGCFYLFDAMMIEQKNVIYLDPDVICTQPIPLTFFSEKISALDLCFPVNQNINGISPLEAANIYKTYNGSTELTLHKHLGGEFLYVPVSIAEELNQKIKMLWKFKLIQVADEKPFWTTEEHILSCLLRDYSITNANQIILRIWTSKTYDNVEGGKFDFSKLPLWHLPAEKSRGFQKIYDQIRFEMFELHQNEKQFQEAVLKTMHLKRGIFYSFRKSFFIIIKQFYVMIKKKNPKSPLST